MKKSLPYKLITIGCLLTLLAVSARADFLTNNFTATFDYVANGIVGDTNWDGVYTTQGDIYLNQNTSDNGQGTTQIAIANGPGVPYPGYLNVRTTGTDFANLADDGFFLWRYVPGDFDMSVQVAPFNFGTGTGFDNRGNNFVGLMVRAFHTNYSGAPFGFPIGTNNASTNENYVMEWRFNEFSLDGEVNEAINGGRVERTYPRPSQAAANTDTNSTRYLRIVRSSLTNFTFYYKTNATDPWYLNTNNLPSVTNAPLPLLALNGPMQVGIAQAAFSTTSRDAVFTDFELSGSTVTNVPWPTAAPGPSGLTTNAIDTSGKLTFTWTKGDPGDGSLVIVRRSGHIQGSPIQGLVYPADAGYGNGTPLSVDRSYVVYNDTGNSVTVSNLAANNTTYTVAVYEWTNSNGTIVYNTAAPATNTFAGPGVVNGVALTAISTNIPAGGATTLRLFATFSTGGTGSDQSAAATWSTSDPTIALVNASGIVSGQTNLGSVTITSAFSGFTVTTNITVHAPVFTDLFTNNVDYVANGLVGSTFDGVYMNFGDVPYGNAGSIVDNVNGQTFILNENITVTNALRVQEAGGTWRFNGDDGPFLYKVVTGDFEISAHVIDNDTLANNFSGLMARLYNQSASVTNGGPGGTAFQETHLNWGNPQQGAATGRNTIDNSTETITPGLGNDRWFLMQRVGSTNFYCYQSPNPAVTPWTLAFSRVIAEASNNVPMQVGLYHEMRAATTGTATYDTLMIDGPGMIPPATPPPPATNTTVTLNNDLSMTFHWVASDGAGNPIRSMLVMRAGAPVNVAPTLAQASTFVQNDPNPATFGGAANFYLGSSNYVVYVTANPAASTNLTVTVNGLTPGVIYYATVYTFTGVGGAKSFNTLVPTNGATAAQQDGSLLGVSASVPTIPLGGVQIPQVLGVFPGSVVNISSFAQWAGFSNTNVVQYAPLSGVLSGMGIGSSLATNVIQTNATGAIVLSNGKGGYTNVVTVTVRAATFNDEFNVNQDYVLNRQTNSPWDGVYLNQGDIPESAFVPGVPGATSAADANVSSNNLLTVSQNSGGWAGPQNDGFFLWKFVPGDFQAAVHVFNTNNIGPAFNYTEAGILGRLYGAGTNDADVGSPYVLPGRGETWVGFTKFDEFSIGTYARKNINNNESQFGQPNQQTLDNWLLILRRNFTNFYFFERATNIEPWRLTPNKLSFSPTGAGALADFAAQPMQVGIQWTPYTANTYTAQFEHYMLDVESGALLSITQATNGNVVISWPLVSGTLQYTLSLNPTSWQTVPQTPAILNSRWTVTLTPPFPQNIAYYRLAE